MTNKNKRTREEDEDEVEGRGAGSGGWYYEAQGGVCCTQRPNQGPVGCQLPVPSGVGKDIHPLGGAWTSPAVRGRSNSTTSAPHSHPNELFSGSNLTNSGTEQIQQNRTPRPTLS